MEKIELAITRDMGQTIGDTLMFSRQNFKTFFRLFVYYLLAPLLVTGALTAFGMKDLFGGSSGLYSSPAYSPGLLKSSGLMLGSAYVAFFLLSIVQNIYVSMYMVLYENNKDTTLSDVWAGIKENWKLIFVSHLMVIPVILTIGLGVGLVVLLADSMGKSLAGFVAFILIVALLYTIVPLSNFYMVRLREKLGFFEALGKSFRITTGHWWRTITAQFILLIIFYMLSMALIIPFYAIVMASVYTNMKTTGNPFGGSGMGSIMGLYTTLGMFWSFFLGYMFYVFIAINYFSLSEKYDHYHLRAEIARIGNPDVQHTLKQEGEY